MTDAYIENRDRFIVVYPKSFNKFFSKVECSTTSRSTES